MPAESPNPEMTPFEAALAGISPAPAGLDRDALMYSAGRRSVHRPRVWPTLACLFAIISLALGVRTIAVGPRVVEKIVVVREPAAIGPADQQASSAISTTPIDSAIELGVGDLSSTNIALNLVHSQTHPSRPDESHPLKPTEMASNWVALPCPSLEQDLGLPSGSLREIQPHESSILLSK